jgi:tetratricopeptide (TPR) repeat protein
MKRLLKRHCLVFFLFLSGAGHLHAVAHRPQLVDSLKAELNKNLSDSVRYDVLNRLVGELRFNQASEAYTYCREMLKMGLNGTNIKRRASAYNTSSIVCREIGDHDKAVEYGYKALGLYEDLHDTMNIAGAFLNISTMYKADGDFVKALDLLDKARQYFGKVHNKKGLAYTYNNMATIYREQKKFPEALDYFHRSLALKLELKETKSLGSVYMNIGIVEVDGDQYDSARYYYRKALIICRKTNNLDGVCDVYTNIGNLARTEKKYAQAKTMLDSAYMLANELKIVENVQDIDKDYYFLYKDWGNSEKALEYFDKYLELKDSVLNEKSSKQTADMAARYESEKKDKDIELSTKQSELIQVQLKKDKVFIIGLIVVSLGAILLALLLYNRFRLRQKLNGQLSLVQLEIQEQKKEMTDSIHYARRIQESVMLRQERIKEILPESFLLYLPKQIVSGDFYWMHREKEEVLLAVVDNTLYGVPGAFISLVGINLLNRAVQEEHILDLNELVNYINKGIISTLKQVKGGEKYAEKLHFSICRINSKKRTLECITTNNSIYLIRDNELKELKCSEPGKPELHKVPLDGKEQIYLFTDGYPNQLGGSEGKKMMVRKLQETLLACSGQTMKDQQTMLEEVLYAWKKDFEQVDDILLIGFRPD